jgi:hypothetical protein
MYAYILSSFLKIILKLFFTSVFVFVFDFVYTYRYAQITYMNLKDHKNGMDQDGRAVARGAANLADVLYQQGSNLIKAEELAREALRIESQLHDPEHEVLLTFIHICTYIYVCIYIYTYIVRTGICDSIFLY